MNTIERGELSALWERLDVAYGPHLDRSDRINITYGDQFSDEYGRTFDELTRAFELFATGERSTSYCRL